MVRELFYAHKNWLISLFNILIKYGIFPESWKISRVALIPKVNKDLTTASHYRPICLLSTIGKLFERVLTYKIIYHLETNNYIKHNQFGFRRGRSTISALQNIKDYANQADSGQYHLPHFIGHHQRIQFRQALNNDLDVMGIRHKKARYIYPNTLNSEKNHRGPMLLNTFRQLFSKAVKDYAADQ
ncbi:reverse transcriptase domain-containing protein [Caerostris darwini]|uniref:Reverse transcriptase domain-containing protein n=1 Tax=Caerostris darwini TaxID=1538125 RepID=A0AAV4M6T6_9ARAC|nr:reverse transcriptase domain-containing protein [Caerostris darwini]